METRVTRAYTQVCMLLVFILDYLYTCIVYDLSIVQNDEVLEYDGDKTSENWLENVIGELQFDSAVEVA